MFCHVLSRLRDDSVLKYKYTGKPTGKKGAPKKFSGKVDIMNLNTSYFYIDLCNEDIKIYSAVVYSKAFKRYIKLAIAVFFRTGKEVTRKLYFSTNL